MIILVKYYQYQLTLMVNQQIVIDSICLLLPILLYRNFQAMNADSNRFNGILNRLSNSIDTIIPKLSRS
jgi:hypothetical protein